MLRIYLELGDDLRGIIHSLAQQGDYNVLCKLLRVENTAVFMVSVSLLSG